MIRLVAIIIILMITFFLLQFANWYDVSDLQREIDQVSQHCEIHSVYEWETATIYNQLCYYKTDNTYTIAKKKLVVVWLYRARWDWRVTR